jgi:hypothetical protein
VQVQVYLAGIAAAGAIAGTRNALHAQL